MPRPPARPSLLALAAAPVLALALAPAAATAAPVAVQGGSIDWSQTNVYNPAPERTYLGFATQPGLATQGRSNGTAATSEGATTIGPDGVAVDAVGPAAPRGVGQQFTFRFPASAGTFDRAARTLDITTTGALTYTLYPALPTPPAPTKLSALRLTLSGTTGAVTAVTSGASGGTDYPAGAPLFTLNAAQSQIVPLGAGRYVISGLVPTLATAGIFGTAQQFPVGTSGPDRTPNTYGGFSVVIDTEAAAAPATVERVVERVVDREVQKLVSVDRTSVVLTASVPRRPFRTASVVQAEVRQPGTTAVLGQAIVAGKRLWIVAPQGTELRGKYLLTRTSGSKRLPRTATVTLDTSAAREARR